MKYGKAVAKVILPISNEGMNYVQQEVKKIGEAYNMWVIVKPIVNDYMKYTEGGFNLTVEFSPKGFTNGIIRHPKTKSRLSLFDLSNDTPYIFADLSYNDSVIEGTETHVNQYHCYVRTHGFLEIPYRHKNVEPYSGYCSFDYDTDIETITKSICDSVKSILEAYKPLIS